jgi:two-component system, OmpR family, response regulator
MRGLELGKSARRKPAPLGVSRPSAGAFLQTSSHKGSQARRARNGSLHGASLIVPGSTPPLRVLLIEDSELLAARLAELIRAIPDVELIGIAAGETEALERIADLRPQVLILDLHLRQGSGFGVLRSLYGSGDLPKVIVLTNYDVSAYRSAAEAFGVVAYLDKARDHRRLRTLLQTFAREQASAPAPGPA